MAVLAIVLAALALLGVAVTVLVVVAERRTKDLAVTATLVPDTLTVRIDVLNTGSRPRVLKAIWTWATIQRPRQAASDSDASWPPGALRAESGRPVQGLPATIDGGSWLTWSGDVPAEVASHPFRFPDASVRAYVVVHLAFGARVTAEIVTTVVR